jgi:hypothetical protein
VTQADDGEPGAPGIPGDDGEIVIVNGKPQRIPPTSGGPGGNGGPGAPGGKAAIRYLTAAQLTTRGLGDRRTRWTR